MVDWNSPNLWIALALIIFTMALFVVVIADRLGGDQALFLIIGYIAAWVEMIVIFFFRKAPPTGLK